MSDEETPSRKTQTMAELARVSKGGEPISHKQRIMDETREQGETDASRKRSSERRKGWERE